MQDSYVGLNLKLENHVCQQTHCISVLVTLFAMTDCGLTIWVTYLISNLDVYWFWDVLIQMILSPCTHCALSQVLVGCTASILFSQISCINLVCWCSQVWSIILCCYIVPVQSPVALLLGNNSFHTLVVPLHYLIFF